MKFLGSRLAGVVSIAISFLLFAGLALATIPDSSGMINACYIPVTGHVRLVDESASCLAVETAISWSANGIPGPPGVSGWQRTVGTTITANGFGGSASAVMTCAPGKKVISGGVNTQAFSLVVVVESYAASDTTWKVTIRNNSGAPNGGTPSIICADVD